MIQDKCCDWPKEASDGVRIMATARYPRGRTKDACDVYMPDLAPEWEVLQQLWSDKITWAKFVSLYRKKLRQPSQRHQLELLAAMSETHGMNVTVMCACENRERCHRSILVEEILAAYRRPEASRRVYPNCVFHIKHSDELNRLHALDDKLPTLVEKGNWAKARAFLDDAQKRGEDLLLLFDHAEEFQGIGWTAIIDDISIKPVGDNHYETSVVIRDLLPLDASQRFPRTELKRASTGDFIDVNYQRGYVPCKTPATLLGPALR